MLSLVFRVVVFVAVTAASVALTLRVGRVLDACPSVTLVTSTLSTSTETVSSCQAPVTPPSKYVTRDTVVSSQTTQCTSL